MTDALQVIPATAARIRQVIGGAGGDPTALARRHGRGLGPSRSGVLARCTSTTAAGASGLAATLYPAKLVPPNSVDAVPADDLNVWLTVLGPSGAVAPALNRVYPAELCGEADGGGSAPSPAVRMRAVAGEPGKAFSGARVRHSAIQGIANNTETALNFDTEDFDTDTYHDNTTNNTDLVIPSSGYYLIGASLEVVTQPGGPPGVGVWILYIYRGAAIMAYDRRPDTRIAGMTVVISTIAQCTAGDVIQARVLQSTGLLSGTVQNLVSPLFWITKIG